MDKIADYSFKITVVYTCSSYLRVRTVHLDPL